MYQATQPKREINPMKAAVIQLKLLEFPMPNIRESLPKLSGISQPDLARRIGTSRQNISSHLGGWRKTSEIRQRFAAESGV